ncbi:trypco2 family protein [Frankia sp. CiP3]|uniref:trypco2 family protein n=1 Tax=Frankia sp. CiP3 TaxID=2880971 RepID=UPI001EF55511|nr:trypco2 family protein [Frankia sp. CiP3]
MELSLAETMDALRVELAEAASAGAGSDFQFPVDGVQLEFHVAVKKESTAKAGVKVWVVEAGGSGSLSREEIHTVTVTLGVPVDRHGEPMKITQGSPKKP